MFIRPQMSQLYQNWIPLALLQLISRGQGIVPDGVNLEGYAVACRWGEMGKGDVIRIEIRGTGIHSHLAHTYLV